MTKEELRTIYKEIRMRMGSAEVNIKNRMINKRLINEIDWQEYKTVCAYLPMTQLIEVDIRPMLSRLRAHTGTTLHIVKPAKDAPPPKQKYDLIFVPCLAYDNNSQRLGWGGGWYDKFLATQPHAKKIGLCFSNGLVEQGIPVEPHDIPLDLVITEV